MWGKEDIQLGIRRRPDFDILTEKEEMRSLIERIERYLNRKKLELNMRKTKVIRFRRGREKRSKKSWKWKRNAIEEVAEFKYLGYIVQRNGG